MLLALALLLGIDAHAQTAPQVWSCLTNCSATSNTYNDGAFRALTPRPAFVAATTGTNTNCATNWWNTNGAVRWRASATLPGDACVSIRTGTVESFASASTLWPSSPPVNCVLGPYVLETTGTFGACSAAGQRTRTDRWRATIATPASNGGTACPNPLPFEDRVVSEACTPPPPPQASVVISVSSQRVYTNEPVTVSWTSENAQSCTASWTQDVVPPSGSQSLTMTAPMPFARVWVRCTGVANEYEAGTGFAVLSRAPDCYAHDDRETDRDKIAVKALSLSNLSLRYQIMATWWCRMPDGSAAQQRFVLGVQDQETIASFRRWLDRQFDEAGVRARCEQNCEVLQPGPLKTELDTWAALPENSAAVLGVIEP
jgi:hypothetical protein